MMKALWFAAVLAASWLVLTTPASAAPVEAYGALPSLEDVTISPDGSKLAYLGENKDGRFLIVQSVSGQLIAGIKINDIKIRAVQWADETHVLVTSSVTAHAEGLLGPRDEYYETLIFDIQEKSLKNLLSRVDGALNTVAGLPERIVFHGTPRVMVAGVYYPGERGVLALYSIDVSTMLTSRVKAGNQATVNFLTDGNGNVVAEESYDENTRRWSLKLHLGDSWKEAYGEDAPIDTPYLAGIAPDGNAILLESRKTGATKMLAFSLADGSAVTPALSRIADPLIDPVSHRIIGERLVGFDVNYRFFSPTDKANWTKVKAHFTDELVELESSSDDRLHLVVHVTGQKDGDAYELIDVASDTVVPIGPVRNGIRSYDLANVTVFSYAAADGLQLDGYLTMPSGRDPHNLPLIVMPHGGPAARDEPGFDWWAQSLASMGYAVFQPQFRGSTGFGWDLLNAGFGQWGRKMQTDLSDGVRALAAKGIVDARRVCIVGASYGGYAAVAGATLDPGVYRCAVAVGAVTDPASFIKWRSSREQRSDSQQERYWSRYMGATGPDDPSLTTISPAKQATRATIPILLIHGKDDTVVPLSQSEDMAKALKKAGKSYDMVVLDGEDHWLSRSRTRTEMLKVSSEFLLVQNPPY